ncbi:MAG: glycosyltransferase family 4 protein [Chloroflexi bacterium]|nr:glycosyltransferase family 4 protein [Chloroflexota bacterium]
MRLTYITTGSFPTSKASSIQVMQMCAAFAEAGAMVKLVARPLESSNNVFDHYGVSRNFLFETPHWLNVPRAADVFQMRAAWRERGDWICYARGRDLVAPFVALLRGARACVEAHGRPLTAREKLMLTWIARHPRGRLIVISPPLQEIYRREFNLESFVASDGVDLKRFEPRLSKEEAREKLGVGQIGNAPTIVYVGGLYEGRGLETLFKGVAALSAQLLIVGGRDSDEVAAWREKAKSLGAENVRFVGYQSPARVPLYLFAADILAMPYSARTLTPSGEETTQWMSPLKLYEYLAAGRPIVASDLPALRYVLTHGENALLATPDDEGALRDSFDQLLKDESLRERLAANARATAERSTWLTRAKKILECAN